MILTPHLPCLAFCSPQPGNRWSVHYSFLFWRKSHKQNHAGQDWLLSLSTAASGAVRGCVDLCPAPLCHSQSPVQSPQLFIHAGPATHVSAQTRVCNSPGPVPERGTAESSGKEPLLTSTSRGCTVCILVSKAREFPLLCEFVSTWYCLILILAMLEGLDY